MSILNVRLLEGLVRFEVGARPGVPLQFLEIVNLAGTHFVGMHPWNWLEGRSVTLRQRASIELAAATWTEATKTLALAGAFTDYGLVSGDVVRIASGTGATPGQYLIATRPTSNTITLSTSIGAAADGQTDIAGRLPNDQVELTQAFDMQAITAIQTSDGLVSSFQWASAQSMLDLRVWPGLRSTVSFRGLVRWVRSALGGVPVPRLEVWPEASESVEFLTLFYRGGWLPPAEDTSELSIPDWCNLLFIEVVKAVVNGFEDPEAGTVDQRVTQLQLGGLFQKAIERDVMFQSDLGPLEQGWTSSPRENWGRYDVPISRTLPAL